MECPLALWAVVAQYKEVTITALKRASKDFIKEPKRIFTARFSCFSTYNTGIYPTHFPMKRQCLLLVSNSFHYRIIGTW